MNIVLFGAGPHANVIIDIIEKQNIHSIVGIIDSKKEIYNQFDDYRIIGRQENLKQLIKEYDIEGGIVCVGDNYWRGFVVKYILSEVTDFKFINAIHPTAIIGKNVKMGVGNVIMPGVIINAYAVLENHCIINSKSLIEHHGIMEDFSSLAPGVTTGGFFKVEKYSAISLGAVVFDRITIGTHVVIGSGALVTKDIEDYSLAYGIPAKIIRKRKAGEKYLK